MILFAAEFVSWRGMGWNLFLAVLPCLLAQALFRPGQRPGLLVWLGIAPFLLLLPNAAYVLTDIVQFVRQVRQTPHLPTRTITLVLLPEYFLFMLVGFEAHVLSVSRLAAYCHRQLRGRWSSVVEVLANFLVAVGIYLGRYHRFNSWDVLRDPQRLLGQTCQDLVNPAALWIIGMIFAVVLPLYYAVKSVNATVAARGRAWQDWSRLSPRGRGI